MKKNHFYKKDNMHHIFKQCLRCLSSCIISLLLSVSFISTTGLSTAYAQMIDSSLPFSEITQNSLSPILFRETTINSQQKDLSPNEEDHIIPKEPGKTKFVYDKLTEELQDLNNAPTTEERCASAERDANSQVDQAAWKQFENSQKILNRELQKWKFGSLMEESLMEEYLKRNNLFYTLTQNDLEYLKGKVVVITGAGGTIGAEAARQLVNVGISRLVLIDKDENGLYDILRELNTRYSDGATKIEVHLCNLLQESKIQSMFDKYKPNVVFHYANYKSLVFGNIAAGEFANLNLGTTLNLLKVSSRSSGFERFIYISSDKAENPTQNYGRTKRINELLIRSFAEKNPNIRYGTMRYCNVLDAAGSFAIPAFRDQIINNLPITLRISEDGIVPNRYFIPKHMAVKFAIKVGREAVNGEIFSLNKNKIQSIRMDDVVRDLARAYGIIDVAGWFEKNVKFVPFAKGEKVAEQLGQGSPLVDVPLIKIIINRVLNFENIIQFVEELQLLGSQTLDNDVLVEEKMQQFLEKNDSPLDSQLLEGEKRLKKLATIHHKEAPYLLALNDLLPDIVTRKRTHVVNVVDNLYKIFDERRSDENYRQRLYKELYDRLQDKDKNGLAEYQNAFEENVMKLYETLPDREKRLLKILAIFHDIGSRTGERDWIHHETGARLIPKVIQQIPEFQNEKNISLEDLKEMVRLHGAMTNVGIDFFPEEVLAHSVAEQDMLFIFSIIDMVSKQNNTNDASHDLIKLWAAKRDLNKKLIDKEKFVVYRIGKSFSPFVLDDEIQRKRLDEIRQYFEKTGFSWDDQFIATWAKIRVNIFDLFTRLTTKRIDSYAALLAQISQEVLNKEPTCQFSDVVVDTDIDFMSLPLDKPKERDDYVSCIFNRIECGQPVLFSSEIRGKTLYLTLQLEEMKRQAQSIRLLAS
jgi:nucleoside-diphosphate-sugar epimerase